MDVLTNIIESLEQTDYKKPQTVSDIISNSSILLEVIDDLLSDKET